MYPNSHSCFYNKIQNFTVVPKQPFMFLQQNTKFYSCTQTAICVFTTKYKILQLHPTAIHVFTTKYKILHLYPNSHSCFYNKIQNFTVVPKQPQMFLQQNIKFYSCTQTSICFFKAKYKVLKIQNFENCTQTPIRSTAICSLSNYTNVDII